MISKQELLQGLNKIMTSSEAEQEVDKIMNNLGINNIDNKEEIGYEQFIKASFNRDKVITEKNLKIIFDTLDKDKSLKISKKELKFFFQGASRNTGIDDSKLDKVILEINANGDGEMDFDEFKSMMFKVI